MEGIIQRIVGLSNPFARFIKQKNAVSIAEQNIEALRLAKGKEILLRMEETKKRLVAMRSAFECEKDFTVIEAYIYEINALELQYSHLFKLAKQEHVKGEIKAFTNSY